MSKTTAPDTKAMLESLNWIDQLSQDNLGEIVAVSKLALSFMETPDFHMNTEMVAQALKAIWSKADDLKNIINGEATKHGVSHTDDEAMRRFAATCKARRIAI